MDAADEIDVIDVLLAQHREIDDALDAVAEAGPPDRAMCMHSAGMLIHTHESIEADVIRPLTRRIVDDGEAVAHARFVEEDQIFELLERLGAMDPADPRFGDAFAVFRDVLGCHMHREEAEEFAPLRSYADRSELVNRGRAARRLVRPLPRPRPLAIPDSRPARHTVGTGTAPETPELRLSDPTAIEDSAMA